MEDGRIREQGSHNELIALGEHTKRSWICRRPALADPVGVASARIDPANPTRKVGFTSRRRGRKGTHGFDTKPTGYLGVLDDFIERESGARERK